MVLLDQSIDDDQQKRSSPVVGLLPLGVFGSSPLESSDEGSSSADDATERR